MLSEQIDFNSSKIIQTDAADICKGKIKTD